MNKNTIIVTVISVVAVMVFLLLAYKFTGNDGSSSTASSQDFAVAKTVAANDHIKWSPDKKIILTEYSDLQCPACKSFHDYIKAQLETDSSESANLRKSITFVYRHFPLLTIHRNALAASYAAEAAGKQEKFFEYSNILFEKQADWENLSNPQDKFTQYAKDLKLDTDQFKKDMNSQEVKDRVQKDMTDGNALGVDSTPTFFLNGKKLENLTTFDQFKQALLDATKASK